jgi:putative two-component system response regulator
MAIADVYDALISVRPYKAAFTADEAAQIIVEGSGSHFDPALVDIFISLCKEFASIAESERGSPESRPL